MRVLSVGLSTVVLAAPASFTVRLDGSTAPVLGGAHVGTLPAAVKVFGRPDRVVSCTASWSRYRVTIAFKPAATAACEGTSLGPWQQVTLRATRWRTQAGLHVGDAVETLHALYPNASQLDFVAPNLWELETGGPLCDGGRPLALAGRIVSGHVSALVVLHVPACG